MNMILRNYFYAVGLVLLGTMYFMSPVEAQFKDLVLVIQNPFALRLIGVVTLILVALDIVWELGFSRKQNGSIGATAVSGRASQPSSFYEADNRPVLDK